MSNAWNALREQIEHFSQAFPEAAIAFADAHREELVACLMRLGDAEAMRLRQPGNESRASLECPTWSAWASG